MNSNMQRGIAAVFKLFDEWEQLKVADLFSRGWSREGSRDGSDWRDERGDRKRMAPQSGACGQQTPVLNQR
jgi:hypothetical protein